MFPFSMILGLLNVCTAIPVLLCFVFSCLIAVARISNNILNENGKSGHPFLVPLLRGNTFRFFTIEYNISYGFVIYDFIMLRYFLCSHFVESFYHKWKLNFAFSASVEMIIWFISFVLLMGCVSLIDLQVSNYPCIPEMNLT